METIKVGDKVNWRTWGNDTSIQVTVKSIEWIKGRKGKPGVPKQEDWCIFYFEETNLWAYENEIEVIYESNMHPIFSNILKPFGIK